jgi:SNF2 family DNA or RNA helicase
LNGIILAPKHKKLVMPWRDDVANIMDVRAIIHNTRKLAVVSHLPRETKLLRNLGVDVPSPILSQYQWPGEPPFESQRVSAALFVTEPRVYDLSDMGTGKSRKCIYAFDYLRQAHVARRMLIAAPLSTLDTVWDAEVFQSFNHLRTAVLHGTRPQRIKALSTNPDIAIINHDGVEVILNELIRWNPDVVVIDELAVYRNANTNRWKCMNALINRHPSTPFVWGLTGRPTPNAPTDAYGQIKLLQTPKVPRAANAFRSQLMLQVSQFKWVPKPDAYDQVFTLMQPAVRFSLDECHDLPATIFSTRMVDMRPQQKRLYDTLMKQMRVMYKGGKVLATNEGVLLNKLLQISSGFVYDSTGTMKFVGSQDRLKLVLDLIAEANKKVLVFASFTAACHILHTLINKKCGAALITGNTSKNERDVIITDFRRSINPHVIVAHPKTMAHGLTLVEADTIIWYGPTSSEQYDQANARVRRPGQDSHTRVVNVCSSEVERRAFTRLQRRQKLQGLLLSMFEEMKDDDE